MKKDYRNKGFTLVEMIVVIVIIGILLAILVPGMFKYIQKAKEQQAIVECHSVVTATQTLSYELYSNDLFIPDTFCTSENKKIILTDADVDGLINDIKFTLNSAQVSYLSYTTSSSITVVYDINNSSVYTIMDGSQNTTTMDSRTDYAKNEYQKIVSDNSLYGQGKPFHNAHDALKDSFFNSAYSELNSYEKNILDGHIENVEQYKWKPCFYTDSDGQQHTFFVVCTDANGQMKTPLMFYNGSYYYYKDWNNNKIGTQSIYDNINTDTKREQFEKIINTTITSSSKEINNDVKQTWVKIVD